MANIIYQIGQAIKDIQDKMDVAEEGESVDWQTEGNHLIIIIDNGDFRFVLASANLKNGHLEDGGEVKDLLDKYEQRKTGRHSTNSRNIC